MKKSVYTSLAVMMLAISAPAFAEETDHTKLTTKNYVDQGLRAVYQVAKDAADKVGNAADGVNPATGLMGAVATLQGKVNALETDAIYTGATGVTVDANNVIRLSAPQDGKRYVFQDGAWVELATVDEWNADVLTTTP